MDKLTLSVLVTSEEFCNAAILRQSRQNKRNGAIITGLGIGMMILGFCGLLFIKYMAGYSSVIFCLIVIGVILICYDSVIAPMFRKTAAVREYEEKEDLHFASTYTFENNTVSIRNGKIEGQIPLTMITEWSETEAQFCFAYGREISICIPKRLMDVQQCSWLRDKLETCAGGTKV